MAETTGESHPTVVIGSRSWSHLVPLLTGVVKPVGFDLDLRSLSSTPDLHAHPELDGSEMSFSRYARARSEGDDRLVGLPAFVMRAFRHRCILVRSDSDLVDLRQLSGCTVGLTGWPDSGNTWTRSLLTRAGVEIDSVKWWLAPVASGDAPKPHDVRALPANVRVAEPGQYLLGALADGSLDAIMTPFTPAALKASDGDFRHLLEDFPAAEASYYRDMGFVPGIHIVALRQEVVDTHPWLPAAVVETLEQSKRAWRAERRRYADTTPWMLEDILRTERITGPDWMPYGIEENQAMVTEFCHELHRQGITPEQIHPSTVFSSYAELAGASGRTGA